MKRKKLSIVLLVAAVASLAFSHLATFSFILPKAAHAIMSAHDVFEKNMKEAVSQTDYTHAYAFDLRDSVVIIEIAKAVHIGAQTTSGVFFLVAFIAAYMRPNPAPVLEPATGAVGL